MMLRFFLFLILLAILLMGSYFYFFSGPSLPQITPEPQGISQSTVNDVRIPRQELLSKDGTRVWVMARVGAENPVDCTILVDLKTNQSLFSVEGAEPLGWLNDTQVLFMSDQHQESILKKIKQRLNKQPMMDHRITFYKVDVHNRSVTPIAALETSSSMTFCSISTDSRWLIATWSPTQLHEISLENGTVSPQVDEKYVWAPCFIDHETYLFVGETSIQSRKIGATTSDRISQPLLQEIRDAIKIKGNPSIDICGKIKDFIYAVDHVPDGRYDRLLQLDERTRMLKEITQLEPSRSLPYFSTTGEYLVYQGNPFNRTQDTVFFQEVLEGSKSVELIHGVAGQVNEANPLFLPGDRVLYIHRGTELRSIHVNEEQPTLHWPQSLLP